MSRGAEAVATAPRRSVAWFSSHLFQAVSRAVTALDPFRFAGAIVFVAIWELASVFIPSIILPGPCSVLRRAATDFWSAPALSYYGVEDPSLAANLAYTAENVAIAAVIGAVIGVTLGLLSARVWFVRAAMDPVMMTAGTVPILIAAPFLLIWFGVGRASAVSLVAATPDLDANCPSSVGASVSSTVTSSVALATRRSPLAARWM